MCKVAFGLKLGVCSDSMEFECMDLVAEEGCADMDSQYRGESRKKAQKKKTEKYYFMATTKAQN